MKKLVSLFLILAMTCSLMLSVSANTPSISFDMMWATYGEETDMFTGEVTWKATGIASTAKAGDKVIALIRATANNYLANMDYTVTYDSSILSYVKCGMSAGTAEANGTTPGVINAAYVNSDYANATGIKNLYAFVFEVKENPVKTLDNLIDIAAKGNENAYYAGGATKVTFDDSAVNFTPAVLTIEGLQEGGSKEFAVEAKLDADGKVVVTAENVGENVGTVYVATYNAGVLVDCEAKALADIADGWTVENLDGTAADAQIYVWNDQNVPLFDNVITVSAE